LAALVIAVLCVLLIPLVIRAATKSRRETHLFAREGAKVALTGRRTAEGEAVVAEIKAAGGSAVFIEGDLENTGSIPAVEEAGRGSSFNHLPGAAGYKPELRSACS